MEEEDMDNETAVSEGISEASHSQDEEARFKGPQFSPRLYKQRYCRVIDVVREYGGKVKKLVDFGCAECRFLRRARTALPQVAHLWGVDIDKELLQDTGSEEIYDDDDYCLDTYFAERRAARLFVRLFAGNVAEFDSRLADVDAVTCIELIEHLQPDQLAAFPDSVFGRYRPLVVAVTTPNREFNALFDMGDREFRHPDHKFEWTRQEFQEWGDDVVRRFPTYSVSYEGIGEPPTDRPDVGSCSQMAVFRMKDEQYETIREGKVEKASAEQEVQGPYEQVFEFDFPYDRLARVAPRLSYWCSVCLQRLYASTYASIDGAPIREPFPEVTQGYQKGVLVPLEALVGCKEVQKFCDDADELGAFMVMEGWRTDFETGAIFHVTEDLPSSSSSESGDEGNDSQTKPFDHSFEEIANSEFRGGFGVDDGGDRGGFGRQKVVSCDEKVI